MTGPYYKQLMDYKDDISETEYEQATSEVDTVIKIMYFLVSQVIIIKYNDETLTSSMAKFEIFGDDSDAKEIWGVLCRCLKDKNNNDEEQLNNNETMSPEKIKWISRRLNMDENPNEVENIWRHRGIDLS